MPKTELVSTPASRIRCLHCQAVNGFQGDVPTQCPDCSSPAVEQCADHVLTLSGGQ